MAQFVVYDKEHVAGKVRDVDVVLNMVDNQADAGMGYLRRGGTFSSIAGMPAEGKCQEAGATCVQIGRGMPADTVALMSKPVDRIQQEIRGLSSTEKEEVLHTLLEELDGQPDEDVEAAWLAEVQRRVREIDSGAVQCIPATEVFSGLDKSLGESAHRLLPAADIFSDEDGVTYLALHHQREPGFLP